MKTNLHVCEQFQDMFMFDALEPEFHKFFSSAS